MSFFTSKATQERREAKESRLASIEERIEQLELNAKTIIGREYASAISKETLEERLSNIIHEQGKQITILCDAQDRLEKQVDDLLHIIQSLERRIGDSRRSSNAPIMPIGFTFGATSLSGSHNIHKDIELEKNE